MAMWLAAAAGCGGPRDGSLDRAADGGEGSADGGGPADAGGPDGGTPLPPIEWRRLAGNASLQVVDISDDGGRVAFTSGASDLVEGDSNGQQDAFVFDPASGAVVRASVSLGGAQASCGRPARAAGGGAACSYAASISGDGETVIFASRAPDLVVDDQNGVFDLFARDLAAGETTRVNVASDGSESDDESWPSAATSRDGRLVAFYSLSSTFVAEPGCAGVYLRDRQAGTTTQVSLTASGETDTGCVIWTTGGVSLAGDGATVAYAFRDGGIVPGVSDHYVSLFARQMAGAASVLVSASSDGQPSDAASERPELSADGRTIAFWSDASNLVAGDHNGTADVFVRDLAAATTERVSLSSAGAEGAGDCGEPSISGDGRFVAFSCARGGLVAGDDGGVRHVYVRDRQAGITALVSRPPDGGAADGDSFAPAISADGRAVAFSSEASNLHGGEADGRADLLVAPNPLAAD
jgi:Tol biopolymer transport system component